MCVWQGCSASLGPEKAEEVPQQAWGVEGSPLHTVYPAWRRGRSADVGEVSSVQASGFFAPGAPCWRVPSTGAAARAPLSGTPQNESSAHQSHLPLNLLQIKVRSLESTPTPLTTLSRFLPFILTCQSWDSTPLSSDGGREVRVTRA